MNTQFPKPCVIEREDDVAKYVKCVDGYTAILIHGSVNGTSQPVGSRGMLHWYSGTSGAWPYFERDFADFKVLRGHERTSAQHLRDSWNAAHPMFPCADETGATIK